MTLHTASSSGTHILPFATCHRLALPCVDLPVDSGSETLTSTTYGALRSPSNEALAGTGERLAGASGTALVAAGHGYAVPDLIAFPVLAQSH